MSFCAERMSCLLNKLAFSDQVIKLPNKVVEFNGIPLLWRSIGYYWFVKSLVFSGTNPGPFISPQLSINAMMVEKDY